MDVPLILLLCLLLAVAGANFSGCIARTALTTSTFQDEMDMWITRSGGAVTVTVDHSEGSCNLKIDDPTLDNMWLRVKLSLKDNIQMLVNEKPFKAETGCVNTLESNTIKTVSVVNAQPLVLGCSQGPAIYQISKVLENVLIPWYKEETELVLQPMNNTQIGIQVGGQDFVICSDGKEVAAQKDASVCRGGVGTYDITLIIPKNNTFIKVKTADGEEAVTQITGGTADALPEVKKALITGTLIMRQCMPKCKGGKDIPDDCYCTLPWALFGVFLAVAILLAIAVAYLLLRTKMSGKTHHSPLASHRDDHGPDDDDDGHVAGTK